METKQFKSLDLQWPLSIPTTVEEYDELAKRPGACLADAIQQTVYHSTLGDVRARFCEVLDEDLRKQGIEVPWDSGKKDSEGESILLNEGAWINKVLATTGKKITDFSHLQALVLEDRILKDEKGAESIVEGVRFDPSGATRKGGPPKVSKKALAAANEIITKAGKRAKEIASKLLGLNPGAKPVSIDPATDLPTPESLAKLIAVDVARKAAEVNLAEQYM